MHREYRPADRRRHPRTSLAMTLGCIRLDPDGGDVVDSLHMTNISRSGLGALCRRNVYATTVRCAQADKGEYGIGFEFDSPYVGSSFAQTQTVAAA